jgi:SAM-dependent methyltransferase
MAAAVETSDYVEGTERAVAVTNPDSVLDCPGCGGAGRKLLFSGTDRFFATTEREFDVVECADCGLIRLFPFPSDEELRTFYPASYWFSPDGQTSGGVVERYRRFVLGDHVRFVAEAVKHAPRGVALDIGCGGALFSHLLKKRGVRVAGLDFALDAARVAWRQNGVPVANALLEMSPLRAESCSVITMFHVLEHLKDPAAYLNEAFRALKPGGRLIVQVPNASSWGFLLFGPNWLGVDVPRHLFNFRARDMGSLLQFCGFELLREKHFSLRDNPACLASSLAPKLDPMSRRVRQADAGRQQLMRDLAYFSLYLACFPLAALEAFCRAGSTVMFEARRP